LSGAAVNPPGLNLEEERRASRLALLQSGEEVEIGRPGDIPWPVELLCNLQEKESFILGQCDSGLTARIFHLTDGERHFALKVARPQCLVKNVDGQTSFLNEVLCRQILHRLRNDAGISEGKLAYQAFTRTHYASLKKGIILSDWIQGQPLTEWDKRRLTQLFDAGIALLLAGLFEWDYCAGNILDDGRQLYLFDFGYTYPFDPLTHFNSAGDGRSAPLFHLAERFETRHYFAYLLEIEETKGLQEALQAFREEKELALLAYQKLIGILQERGADKVVTDWLQGYCTEWSLALAGDLQPLYLKEGWRSHGLDLEDDLSGHSCTPMTLRRADWLLQATERHYSDLRRWNALGQAGEAVPRATLQAEFQRKRELAASLQVSRWTAES
jgi:hypothetical protein